MIVTLGVPDAGPLTASQPTAAHHRLPITVIASDGGGTTGPCALSVDDEIRWSGTCGDRVRTRIAVGGLDPSTTYTVVLTARNPDGTTTRTDPVSVTTD